MGGNKTNNGSSSRKGPMTQKYDPGMKNSSYFKGGAKNGDNDTLCKNRTMYLSVTNLDGTDITSGGSAARLLETATSN